MSTDGVNTIALRVLLGGVLILAFGLLSNWSADSGDPYDIVCDGQQMSAGDRCISTSSSSNGTYEELVAKKRESMAEQQSYGPPLAGLGVVLIVGSGLVLILRSPLGLKSTQAPKDSDWWTGRS